MVDPQKQHFRDIILVEADALNMQAEILEKLAESGVARAVLERRLQVHARGCRRRANALNLVLALNQSDEAKTP